MLGRHHLAISMGVVVPFLIPMLFKQNVNLILPLTFLLAVMIGSLTPDADCGGKSKLYYNFNIVDWIMKKTVTPTVLFIFKLLSKKKVLEYEVKEEHRGIMHSPIGVLISSFLLTIILLIIVLVIGAFNFWILIIIFFGLLIGQFLHLMEDSFTISGINWKFPFGTKQVLGEIYTFPKIEKKRDIRPEIFIYSLGFFSLIILLSFIFNAIKISLIIYYIIILIIVLLIIWINFLLAKSKSQRWYQDAKKVRKVKRFLNPRFKSNSYHPYNNP